MANPIDHNVICVKKLSKTNIVLHSLGSPTPPPIINVGLEQAVEGNTGEKPTLILGRGAGAGLAKYFRHDCLRNRKWHINEANFEAP